MLISSGARMTAPTPKKPSSTVGNPIRGRVPSLKTPAHVRHITGYVVCYTLIIVILFSYERGIDYRTLQHQVLTNPQCRALYQPLSPPSDRPHPRNPEYPFHQHHQPNHVRRLHQRRILTPPFQALRRLRTPVGQGRTRTCLV